jgi:hypothetical protein
VTLAEISRSIQRSAFSIQPAQQFGAVSTGILPSKDAKAKKVFSIQRPDCAAARSIGPETAKATQRRTTEERRGKPFLPQICNDERRF